MLADVPYAQVLAYVCVGFFLGAYFSGTRSRPTAETMGASADKLSERQKRQLMNVRPEKVSVMWVPGINSMWCVKKSFTK